MQAHLHLTKDDCLMLLNQYYTNEYRVPVEVIPVFPLLLSENRRPVFFRMNDSMLDENGFLTFLTRLFEQAGFIVMQVTPYVNMGENLDFLGVSLIINPTAEMNLTMLPEWLSDRTKNLKFADRVLIRKIQH